ncbi:nucleotide-binding protein [Thermoplasma sp. Kam2015]|nr:nucleotide-binding protein [Thermoplasma sp. Kam2015]
MLILMSQKLHCIICGSTIYSGLYCSDCLSEIQRARTMDDESFEDWLSRTRESGSIKVKETECIPLDNFL